MEICKSCVQAPGDNGGLLRIKVLGRSRTASGMEEGIGLNRVPGAAYTVRGRAFGFF